MSFKGITYSLKKWLVFLGLGLVVGLAAGFISVQFQIPVYQATAKILVASNQQTKSADLIYLSNQQPIQTYIELLKTKPILDAASAKLGMVIDPDKVSVLQVTDNQIIHVIVEDSDSERAAKIANTLVEVLIDQNNTTQTDRYSTYENALNSQIEDTKKQITSQQDQIQQIIDANIQEQITQTNAQIAQLKVEISQLETEIATLEQDIAKFPVYLTNQERASRTEKESQLEKDKSLLSNYQQILTNLIYNGKSSQNNTSSVDTRIANIQLALNLNQQTFLTLMNNLQALRLDRLQNTRTVTVIDPAIPPVDPIRPKPLLFMILAGTAGLVLVIGGILLQSYFDNSLKFSSDVEETLSLSVLGTIFSQRQPEDGPIVARHPTARSAQGFRKLGVVLKLSDGEKTIQTMMVTSPGNGEGKTTVAANLASVFARQGKHVLLIDANFGHPSIHNLLGLKDEQGFAEILHGEQELPESGNDNGLPIDWINETNIPPRYSVIQHYQNEGYGSFLVLPAGKSTQPNEFDQVEKVAQIMKELRKLAEVIILDAPPTSSANASMLATHADAILIVIKSGYTKIDDAFHAIQELKRQGAKIIGIVLNQTPEG